MAINWRNYFRQSTIFRRTHISIIKIDSLLHIPEIHICIIYIYTHWYHIPSLSNVYPMFILRCTPARYICSTADTIHCCMQCRNLCWSSGQMGGPWKINCAAGFRKFNDCWEYFPTSRRPSEKENLPRAMCSPRMMTFSFVNWLTLW